MVDMLPEYVDLVHGIFLCHPLIVAKLFEGYKDSLSELLEAIKDQNAETVTSSEIDDLDELISAAEVVKGCLDSGVGQCIEAFSGRQVFITDLLRVIQTGQTSSSDKVIELTDDSNLLTLLEALKSASKIVVKSQAATLLRSNLWIKPENPQLILEHRGVSILKQAIHSHPDEDELVVKCCQTLELLFGYRGVMKQACANSRQIINGKYLIALGKTWEPSNFLCGRTRQPITDQFYIFHRVPYLPSALTEQEKEGLVLHQVKIVEPTDKENPYACIPYIQEFLENNGLTQFITDIAHNLKITKDEYVAGAASKTLKLLVDQDTIYVENLVAILKDHPQDENIAAVISACFLIKATFTDDILRPFSSTILSILEPLQPKAIDNDVFRRKSKLLMDRLKSF